MNGMCQRIDPHRGLKLFKLCQIGLLTLQGRIRIDLRVLNSLQTQASTIIKFKLGLISPNNIYLMKSPEWKRARSENNDKFL